MAAYVQNVITDNTTAGNKAATITPATNGLLVVACHTAAMAVAPTVTDNQTGGTYTLVGTCVRASSASGAWIFIRDALSTAVAHVVTMVPGGADSGGGLNVFEFSGMQRTGASASKQAAVQDNAAAAGTPAPVFGAAVLTGNPTVGLVHNATNPATMTPPASWTERQDVGFATPAAGLETVTRDSGFTGTTVTWGGTSASAFGALVVELDTAAPPSVSGINFSSSTDAITYTTGSVTFANTTLPVAFTLSTKTTPETDWVLTDSLGGTWTRITSALGATSTMRLELWIRTALSSGSSMTLTYSHASGTSFFCLIQAFGVPSMTLTGVSAIKSGTQFGTQDNASSASAPAPALPASATTTNPTIGAVGVAVGVTPPTSWEELWDVAVAEGRDLETVYRASGFTGTTVTWGSAPSGVSMASIIAELDASSGAVTLPPRPLSVQTAVSRASTW